MMNRVVIFLLLFGMSFASSAQECGIYYVTPNGAGSGTQNSPMAMQAALASVAPGTDHIRLAVGTYTFAQQLDLVSGVVIEGGYDPATWLKSNNGITMIYRNNANQLNGPARIVAVSAVGLSSFRLHDLSIEVEDAIGIGVTTYGLHIDGCSDYAIVRCKITAGSGSDGVSGLVGVDGVDGATGTVGQNGANVGNAANGGGVGGNGWSAGSAAGGNGGSGGPEGEDSNFNPFNFHTGDGFDGQNGTAGAGASPGVAGVRGLEFEYTLAANPCGIFGLGQGCGDGGINSFGTDGGDALVNGLNGANGLDGTISHVGGFFVPGDGQNGLDGVAGSGGGGGGGSGSAGQGWSTCDAGTGAGGGGGGEGGQGGSGASGGTGGGGSFAIYIANNGTGGEVKDCNLTSNLPGFGGVGGFPGGIGGFGGLGGQGGLALDNGQSCMSGGDGGDGSAAGNGGNGGNGAAGVSQPIFQNPLGIPVTQISLNANVEPEIVINNSSCTFSDIDFTTNAFGILQWFYEGNTDPVNALGNTVTVQYSNMGFHGMTMVANGVPYQLSDFVHIFQDGMPFLPTIQASDDTICPGQTVNFSATWPSAFNVLGYRWDFGDPNSASNTSASATPAHTYNDVGTYLVQVQTESPCCGWSKIDSFYVEVLPNVNPEVYITVSSSEICEGEIVTFGAVAYFGGPSPTYEWFLNNASAGNGPSFTPGALTDGDEVYVQMTGSYPCPPNAQVNSEIVVMTVHPLPVIDCSNVANSYLGANTLFNAQMSVGTAPFTFAWQFGDGGFSTEQSPSYEYGSTGTYNASVEVTDTFGCSSVCDVQVDIVLPPFVDAGFTYVITQECGNTTVQFTDTSTGNPTSWLWNFGDGQFAAVPTPFVTFNAPGPYSVELIASNGIFTDTFTFPNLVEVWEIPVADFYPEVLEQCDSLPLRFFDESTDAVEWSWDFGDALAVGGNSSDLQNPFHVYNDPGTYTINMTVTSDDGCTGDAAPVDVIIHKSPVSVFAVDSPVCATVPVIFTDMSYDDVDIDLWTYRFSKDGPEEDFNNEDEYEHIFDEPGFYEVTQFVRNDLGCSDSSKHIVEVRPFPFAEFHPDSIALMLPDSVMEFWNTSLYAQDDLTHWDFGNGYIVEGMFDAIGVFPDSGLFPITLTVTNELGCVDDTIIDFRVWEQETFFIASAFTPNNDGINDVFDIREKGIIEWQMSIYDRWGKVIFESDDVKESWNGRNMYSGKEMPQDAYAYRIRLTWYTGRKFERQGTITLIR